VDWTSRCAKASEQLNWQAEGDAIKEAMLASSIG